MARKKILYKEWMLRTLTKMCKPGEKVQYPVYGTYFPDSNSVFGFFGLTKGHLLIALVNFQNQTIGEAVRVPLDVKAVSIRKTWLGQYLIAMEMNDGERYHFRLSRKVVGIDCQQENVEGLVEHLKTTYGA